jgi:hypothetical protein
VSKKWLIQTDARIMNMDFVFWIRSQKITKLCCTIVRLLFQGNLLFAVKKRGKAIPVPGHGGPKGCERLRVPRYLDNRLTDGGKVVSLTRRPPFTPQEDSWYSFLLGAESTPASATGRIRSIEKNPPHRNSNPRPSDIVSQPTTLPRAICRLVNITGT